MCDRCAVKRRARGSADEVRRRRAIEEGKDISTSLEERGVYFLFNCGRSRDFIPFDLESAFRDARG